ncbi:MAG: HEPN domain-containing protein [Spirochaetales bacterium]|jgi:HEPN domain-containing protein|nr:HEPN domain-containing protein [Spirochaetales bacterium]
MDRAEELRQWFAIALQDLTLAEHAATMMHPTPDEQICYLCQQAAEKYLKGFLFLNHIEPPKIHDLPALRKMCEELVPEFSILMPKTRALNQYGVMPRYPSELQITSDDMKLALRYAKDIKEFVLSVCPI